MKVDSRSFPENICTPEFKSIRGRGSRHKLLLFWNLNVTSNKTEHMFPLSK
jgi:hypothetical protein